MTRLRLGTRGSALALWQARHVAARLRSLHPGLEVEEIIIRTAGDGGTKQLGATSDRGVFVKEIEEALLDDRIDLAVHSLKDVPTRLPEGLEIVAVPERHDPRDALLTVEGRTLATLPSGTAVATGSFRRRCQILHTRPDLEVVPVRGNVDTRIRKLVEGEYGALMLALAGVERLGIDRVEIRPVPLETCLPAVGQGALGVEARANDARTGRLLRPLQHEESFRAVEAERVFLHRLGGGCLAPATGFATLVGETLHLRGVVGEPDGSRLIRDDGSGNVADAREIAESLADRMRKAGADRILEALRKAAGEDHDA